MGVVLDRFTTRRDNAGLVSLPVDPLPPGCKGAACPAFVTCQGRCAIRRVEREIARDGYPDGVLAG
jgi:hypothetical protein